MTNDAASGSENSAGQPANGPTTTPPNESDSPPRDKRAVIGGTSHRHAGGGAAALAFGTLGIVFGDIGTSPLYSLRETFHHAELTIDTTSVYGVASTSFWSMVTVISLKYIGLVMRANNHGEGGILALTALVMPRSGQTPTRTGAAIITLGVFGTALLYGDGLITPAISVLSAVEGFGVATSAFDAWVIPVSIVILIGLFAVQSRGTAGIAKVFSPVMVVWFATLGLLGIRQIISYPEVLKAASPTYAVAWFIDQPLSAFLALGSIFLVVTGGEALYADMGHFGRRPIMIAWYAVVMPALVLNYFGQAAMMSSWEGKIGERAPFYEMAPSWAILPLAVLATLSTVIASQALISGAFSLTAQAVQLDYFPRVDIRHTSHEHAGQVYVPLVNWLLMIGCIGLVLAFRTSSALASAYGIAVTTTMLITTMIFYRVVRDRWGWSTPKTLAILIPFFVVDVAFLGANIPKIPQGGWFPLLVGAGLAVQMTTWRQGRKLVATRTQRGQVSSEHLVELLGRDTVARVPGTGVYLSKAAGVAPPALLANMRHNHVVHEQALLVTIRVAEQPHVPVRRRVEQSDLGSGLHQVLLNFGYMDQPNVPATLATVYIDGKRVRPRKVTYFIGHETVRSTPQEGMSRWREELFVLLNRGAASASRFFGLPSQRVFEVGSQIDL